MRARMKFNYDNRPDLSDPWYKNEGCVSPLIFFILLAIGMTILAFIPN